MSNIDKQAQYESKFSRLWERYDEASHGNAEQMRDILEVTLDALESAERKILMLEKLAAENAALKSFGDKLSEMHNDLNGEGTGIQGRAEVACQQIALEAAMEEFDAIKTPATDAFLAEVRAQGVDALVERRLTAARLAKEAGHEITARDLEGEAIRARIFAMELRKGVQS